MSLPKRNVHALLREQESGQALAHGIIRTRLNRPDIDGSNRHIMPEWEIFTANEHGEITLTLWPNALGTVGSRYEYWVLHPTTGRILIEGTFYVPDQPDSFLADISDIRGYPDKDEAEYAIELAQAARNEAKNWATYPVDLPVPGSEGEFYSAYHHAVKSREAEVIATEQTALTTEQAERAITARSGAEAAEQAAAGHATQAGLEKDAAVTARQGAEAAQSAAESAQTIAEAKAAATALDAEATAADRSAVAADKADVATMKTAVEASEAAVAANQATVAADRTATEAARDDAQAAATTATQQADIATSEATAAKQAKMDAQAAQLAAEAAATQTNLDQQATAADRSAVATDRTAVAEDRAAAQTARIGAEEAAATATTQAGIATDAANLSTANQEATAADRTATAEHRQAAEAARDDAREWAVGTTDSAKYWAEYAEERAVGGLKYMGAWDASTEAYPATAELGNLYKVSVAHVFDGRDYRVGDHIIYNGGDIASAAGWDHTDNNETVTSVAGKVGNITLTKEDVGLAAVRNVSAYSQAETDDLLADKSDITHHHDTRYAPLAHTSNVSNPHNVTKAQVGLGNVDNVRQASKTAFDAHTADTANPHEVTKAQVGLGNVRNVASYSQTETDALLADKSDTTHTHAWDEIQDKPATFPPSTHEHADATSSAAGFMSAADKQKLDGIEAGAEVNTVASVNGQTGTVVLDAADVGATPAAHASDTANPHNVTAAQVPITDSGNHYTGTTVEAALQEEAAARKAAEEALQQEILAMAIALG